MSTTTPHSNGLSTVSSIHAALQYKQLGNAAYESYQLIHAIHYFTQGIELCEDIIATPQYDPQLHCVLYSNRSAIHLEQYNYDHALSDAQHSIQLNKTWYKSYIRQAQAYDGLKQYTDAIRSYEHALTLHPDSTNTLYCNERIQAIQSIIQLNKQQIQHTNNKDLVVINHIEQNEVTRHDNDRYANMINWLLNDGTTKLNKLYIKSYSSDSRGVCALEHIYNNEIILQVPLQYIITSEIARNSTIGQLIIQSNISLNSSHTFLACYLLYEKYINADTQWKYYLQCLPEHYTNMPIFYSGDMVTKYLTGSFTVQKINDRINELYDEYTNLCNKISMCKQFTLDQFIWARLVVITRIFGLVINERKTDGLVPLADLLNHKRPRETSWNFDDTTQCFIITSLCDIKQYSNVYDSYGRKCNSRFFVNYGFSLEHNFDDNNAVVYIVLNESLYTNFQLKCRLYGISSTQYDTNRRYQISTDLNDKSTKELYSLCRLFYCSSNELIQLQQNNEYNNKDLLPVSLTNELLVLKSIHDAAQHSLSQFTDTLETDYQLIEQHNSGVTILSDNIYNCILQRKGEKEILTWYIQLYQYMNDLASLNMKQIKKYSIPIELGRAQMERYMHDIFIPLIKQAQRQQ